MGERDLYSFQEQLHPGDGFDCHMCSQRAVALLNDAVLECSICLLQIQDYDTTCHDRVSLDEEGRMQGRGPGSRGGRIQGSEIGASGTGNQRRWRRLASIDRSGRGGASRSKAESMRIIREKATTPSHCRVALDLLDIGWPDRGASSATKEAKENPMWKPAHPRGVPSSAAVCLHLAAYQLGFDSKFEEWVEICMPGVPKSKSFGFRCLKRMRAILGESRLRRDSMDREAGQILARANLGEIGLGGISPMIWDRWVSITMSGGNESNHPRPVLAAICHSIAESQGMPVSSDEIARRFNIEKWTYRNWVRRASILSGVRPEKDP